MREYDRLDAACYDYSIGAPFGSLVSALEQVAEFVYPPGGFAILPAAPAWSRQEL